MNFNLRRNTALAITETVASVVALLLLYRVILVHLTLRDLGVWSLVIASVTVARLGDLGVAAGVNRFVAVADARSDAKRVVLIMETAVIAVGVLYLGLGLVAYGPVWWLLKYAVSGEQLDTARLLLPFALCSLVLTSVSGVISSCLSGVQRSYVKSLVAVLGSFVLLASAVVLLPRFGLEGVATAQIAQGTFLVIVGWAALRRSMPGLGAVPTSFRWNELQPLIAYGAQVQLGSVAGFFFEPVTKMLMARYGGLDSLGIYEVALRMVIQTRNLITAANQTLVSAFAGLNESDPSTVFHLFDRSVRLTSIFSIILLCGLAAASPLASLLILHSISSQFIYFTCILCVSWGANTLFTPVYMLGLGLGDVRFNLASHMVIAIVSPIAALLLGRTLGAIGVVLGAMIGLLAGTAVLGVGYKVAFEAMRRLPDPTRHAAGGRARNTLETHSQC